MGGAKARGGDSLPLLHFKALCGAAYIDPRALRFVKEMNEGETQVVELATLTTSPPDTSSAANTTHCSSSTDATATIIAVPGMAVAEAGGGTPGTAVAGGGTPGTAVAGGGAGQPRQVVVKSYRPHIVGSPQEMRALVKAAVHMHTLASSPEYR